MINLNKTVSQILNGCRNESYTNKQDDHNSDFLKIYNNDSIEKLESDVNNFIDSQKVCSSIVEYASINKVQAICSLLVIIYLF